MEHKGTVLLETERLILRQFVPEDAAAMFRNWANDPAVTKYLTWNVHPDPAATENVLRAWAAQYERPDYYQWAIVPKAVGEPVGSIGAVAVHDDTEQLEAGYCIGQAWWHKGIMSETFAAVIRFWFEQVKANRIEAIHHAENTRSGDVMRRCGLSYEGTLRQRCRKGSGNLYDVCIYSILAEQYFNQ